ncbi:MAG: hypothetical protein ACOZHQ_14080 [Thermodesulfobacteriota bacterium]
MLLDAVGQGLQGLLVELAAGLVRIGLDSRRVNLQEAPGAGAINGYRRRARPHIQAGGLAGQLVA